MRACTCHGPSAVSQFRGPPAAELLAAESDQLLASIEPALARLLELTPGPEASTWLLGSVPVLYLKFHPLNPTRRLTDTDRPGILDAFAALASHSQRLSAFPELKTAFWLDMLQSAMAFDSTRDVHKTSFQHAAFPQFVVDFGHYHSPCEVSERLGDDLYAFMTTPAAPAQSLSSPSVVTFGLSFARCKLTAVSLEILECWLDRTFAHPERQHTIRVLNLSENRMNAPELAVVARIVEKSKSVYQIEELKLNGIIPPIVTSDWSAPAETPSDFLDIVRTAFDVNELPALDSRVRERSAARGSKQQQPSQLRKISLSDNYVCPTFFAAHFSALRYGCSLEANTSSYLAKQYASLEEKVECWRWLAFGLFCPRPRRFASAFKLRTIGGFDCEPSAVATFAKMLQDPVAEIVYSGKGGSDRSESVAPRDTLIVCTVKQGANIEIFKSGFKSAVTQTGALQERVELEALYERDDGAVCVVVPGVGLGSQKQLETLRILLTSIGQQVRSLTIEFIESKAGAMELVLEHCTSLEHLHVACISRKAVGVLLDALDGDDLGARLLSLNLNNCRDCSRDSADKLAAILAKTENPPALRELRLHWCGYGAERLTNLHDALQANRTLELIELTKQKSWRGDSMRTERERLDEAFQGQLLQAAVPAETKTAFISVVTGEAQDAKRSARSALNVSLLLLIFAFAASPVVQRQIAWNADIRCRHY